MFLHTSISFITTIDPDKICVEIFPNFNNVNILLFIIMLIFHAKEGNLMRYSKQSFTRFGSSTAKITNLGSEPAKCRFADLASQSLN